jgi:hypothetical protein
MERINARQRGAARDGPRPLPTSAIGRFADLAFEDFGLRLRALNCVFEQAIAHQASLVRQIGRAASPGLSMTAEDAEHLLTGLRSLDAGPATLTPLTHLTSSECQQQEHLRQCAVETGHLLPFDRLAEDLDLSPFEVDVVALCTAAEIDRGYGRLFGFILDNLNRQAPSIELLCTLGNSGIRERLARRRTLGPQARLRRSGIISAVDSSERPLHTTLAVSPAVFRRIAQPGTWSDRFFDPDLIVASPPRLDLFPESESLASLAAGIRNRRIQICGVWGSREHGVSDAVVGIAVAANRPLFRLPTSAADLDATLAAAEDRHGMLWVRVDALAETPAQADSWRDAVAERLTRSALPVCLSGEFPWRPTDLLAARNYAEVRLRTASWRVRKRLWHEAFQDLDDMQAGDMAARFRLNAHEVEAVSRVARASAALSLDGEQCTPAQRLDNACTQVTQRHGMRFARLVEPRRGPDDLVLPADLHRQVLEVARFYRALLRVDEEWGFQRIATGGGGIKALFTGDSGTGKTLAAEVIAGQLGLGLMKIDLSQLVSKWVGETEKNLECAFREAEDSHAVLFFDEADTLCGKRGEIRNGSDRYANLEVGFLLQRLEQYGGLAILATNLSEEMDQAFVRRFQVALYFPRPREAERRRLWQTAFPPSAPWDQSIDLDTLVKLDMTGASIAGAARMAALLAADEGCDRICDTHLTEGIKRQYQREARLLNDAALKSPPRILKPRR